jgi:hypothetical protein
MRDCAPVAVQTVRSRTVASFQVDGEAGRGKLGAEIEVAEFVEEVFCQLL